MKKILLTLSLFACVSSYAQTLVGIGATDDFNSATELGDATAGLYWWEDNAYPNDFALTRTGTTLSVACTKTSKDGSNNPTYSAIGVGFGDDNGATAGGNPNYIDITGSKSISFQASGTSDAGTPSNGFPSLYFQVKDINNVVGEILPVSGPSNAPAGDGAKYGQSALTTTLTTYTYDITGMLSATWTCQNYPTDCPIRGSAVDLTKVKEIIFFIFGGKDYTGTVVIDNFKIGVQAPANSSVLGANGLTPTLDATASISSSKLFPNPTTADVTLSMELKSPSDVKVVVSDVLGKEMMTVLEGNFSSVDNKTFPTEGLATGVYNVTYYVNGAVAKTELLMKK